MEVENNNKSYEEIGNENNHPRGAAVVYNLAKMFERVSTSRAVVKNQQRGDPDLTKEEKIKILNGIYDKNKVDFLYKFGTFLKKEDLDHHFSSDNNYELNFYVQKLRKSLNPTEHDRNIRNRRYNYLKNVLRKTDYFSEKELEKRDPLLYKQYVDHYKTKDDRLKEKDDNLANQTFSQFLFSTIDRDLNNFRCVLETEAQENQEEEEESDEDDDEDYKKYLDGKVPISDEDKSLFYKEFIELMENRFLKGEDDFDYEMIDNNDEYDDYMDQDMEDKYFDED